MERNWVSFLKKRYWIFFTLVFLINCNVSYALPFNVLPTSGTTLPTTITTGSTVPAFYTVSNNTVSPRNNNFVKYLPPHVSQVTTGGTGTCGSTFNLAAKGKPGDSCILQLLVSGPVNAKDPNSHHHLFVCFPGGTTCAGTSFPLNVMISDTPPTPAGFATITVTGSPLLLTANGPSGTLTITNTSLTTTALNIASNFTGTALAGNVTETGNTCASVAPGATCTLTFTPGSNRAPLTLFPIQGSNTNTLSAAITIQSLFAYITNDFGTGANNVTRCEILSDGTFAIPCAVTGSNLTNPFGIIFNSARTLAYITNIDTSDVTKCSVDADANFNCALLTSGTNLNSPSAMVFNATETLIYLANFGGTDVTKCSFTNTGDLENCVASGTGILSPFSLAIHPSGTYMYVSNFGTNNVTKCEFDLNRNLTACVNSGSNLDSPAGIAINSAGTRIYIVNAGVLHQDVTKCDFLGNGNLTNCTAAGGDPFLFDPRLITFNSDETAVYIANASGNNVTRCDINGAGNLINCVNIGDNMSGSSGIQLVLI